MKIFAIVILLECIFWLILLARYRKAGFEASRMIMLLLIIMLPAAWFYSDYIGIYQPQTSSYPMIFIITLTAVISLINMIISRKENRKATMWISWIYAFVAVCCIVVYAVFPGSLTIVSFIVVLPGVMCLFWCIREFWLSIRSGQFTGKWFMEYPMKLSILLLLFGFFLVLFFSMYIFGFPFLNVLGATAAIVLAVLIFVICYTFLANYFNRWQPATKTNQVFKPVAGDAAQQLKLLMQEDKLYTDPDFCLEMLAENLGLSIFQTSQLLNQSMKTSFYDMVNRYRVEEVKRRLSMSDDRHFTLLAIAFESGFKSKSTFNRIFKEFTGQTPGDYSKSLK